LTVIQLELPLHECAVEPLQDAAEFIADPAAAEATTDPSAIEFVAEPLHSAADLAGSVAALTETFYLYVRV
jgi:hypothetical protein